MSRNAQREWLAEHADHRYWVIQHGYPKPFGCRDEIKGRLRAPCAHYVFLVAHQGKTIGELDREAELAAQYLAEGRMEEYPGIPLIEAAIQQLQVRTRAPEVLELVLDLQQRLWQQASMELAYCAETERRWVSIFPRARRPVPAAEV